MYRFFLIFLLSIFNLQAQTITGTVTYENKPVPFATILIRDLNSPNSVVQFSNSNHDGVYTIQLKAKFNSVQIEVNTIDFESQFKIINNIQNSNSAIIQNFFLQSKSTQIEEIVIKKDPPITINKDTITYNPDSFKDGTEKVAEDLIKKLPGFKVEENGEIKYKGKSISKFLLDGDDLFSTQYVSGSRNITIDMIEKVQAIEKYNDNEVLSGLINSEDVAVNLILKRGKTALSGEVTINVGIIDRYKINSTGMLVNNKTKGLVFMGYNNLGENSSSYDFSSDMITLNEQDERINFSKYLISQGNFTSQLDNKYHRFNNTLFTQANFLTKVSPKVSLLAKIDLFDDKLSRRNSSYDDYKLANNRFETTGNENMTKSPRLYAIYLQLINKISRSLKFDYNGSVNYHSIFYKNLSNNNDLLQNNEVNSKNISTNQIINISKRLNEDNAITGNFAFLHNTASQNYLLTPGLTFNPIEGDILYNKQYSNNVKSTFTATTEYYISSNDLKWKFLSGYQYYKIMLKTNLSANYGIDDVFLDTEFQNKMTYLVNSPYAAFNLSYIKNKKYGIGLLLNAQYSKLELNDIIRRKNERINNFLLVPIIKAFYKTSPYSDFVASYSYNEMTPIETNLFEGIVLTGFRNFKNNTPDLAFLGIRKYNFSYNYHNLIAIKKVAINLAYTRNNNNYFSKTIINQSNTYTNSFFLNSGKKDFNVSLDLENYLNFIKSTFQFNSTYTISFDKNVLNESNLRNIESRFLMLNCSFRKNLKSGFILENKSSFFNHEYFLENVKQNQISSLNNTLKIIYKIGPKFRSDVSYNFISTDLSKNNNYSFFDSTLSYIPENGKFQYSLIMKNLTNLRNFKTTYISDFSKSIFAHNLIERYIMGSLTFRF